MQLKFTNNLGLYKMKKIFKIAPLLAVLACPLIASADYLDVIEFKMKEGCTMAKYMDIVKDFNTNAESRGYKAEILMPYYGNTLDSIIWVGRSKNLEAFGKGANAYYDAAADANSAEGKLGARFRECSTSIARRSYRTR